MFSKIKFLIFCPLIIFGFLFLVNSAYAADPLFMVSWKSQNSAPVWFEGKSFPINNSIVNVSFDLISQNAADFEKIINLKDSEVRWYVNDDLIRRGDGLQSFSFKDKDFFGISTDVKISAKFFDSESGSTYFVNKYISIPVVNPEVVIENKSFSKSVPSNATISLKGIPFFFNSSNDALDINWSVNGKGVVLDQADPFSLLIKLGSNIFSGGLISAIFSVDGGTIFERASKSVQFKIQ